MVEIAYTIVNRQPLVLQKWPKIATDANVSVRLLVDEFKVGNDTRLVMS